MNTRCHTFTGQGFDPFNIHAKDVRLEDIAHHLAMICRYGGACPKFYSVAEHAVRVSDLVLDKTNDPMLALQALHHDSAEAYIHDIRRPIKKNLMVLIHDYVFSFDVLEDDVQEAIRYAFSLPELGIDHEKMIAAADNAMLIAEMQSFGMAPPADLETGGMIGGMVEQPYGWTAAKQIFLRTHDKLRRRIENAA